MGPLFGLVEVELGPPGHNLFLVGKVVVQHLLQVQDFRLSVDQGEHDDAEGVGKLGVLIELVQHHIRVYVFPEFDGNPHALAAGLIGQGRDAVQLLVLHEVRNTFNQAGLVDSVRELRDDNPMLAVGHGLNIRDGPDLDLASARRIGFRNAPGAENLAARGEVGSLDDFHEFGQLCFAAFAHLVIDYFHDCIDGLPQIVGRDVRRHADRNAGGAVDQQVREAGGQHYGLLLGSVEVGREVYGVLHQVLQHGHGNLGKTGLRVPHGGRAVPVDTTEVSMPVDQRVPRVPLLGQIYESPVNGGIPVGMVLTHGIADDSGALPVGLVRRVGELDHGIEHTPLHRLQAVPYIGQGAGSDNAHRVVDVGRLHGLLEAYFLYVVKYCVVHYLSLLETMNISERQEKSVFLY